MFVAAVDKVSCRVGIRFVRYPDASRASNPSEIADTEREITVQDFTLSWSNDANS